MPSHTLAEALLTLASSDQVGAWESDVWCTHTKIDVPIYSNNAEASKQVTAEELAAIRVFAINFWNHPETARAQYIKKQNDSEAVGRNVWCKWVNKNWQASWKINTVVNEVLNNNNSSPYAIMQKMKVKEVRHT